MGDLEERLAEALEQQTATSEILRVISRSPSDLQPVLAAVVLNASRMCGAANVSLYRVEGTLMRKVAEEGAQLTSLRVNETRPITRTSISGRAIIERTTIYVPDHQAAEAAREYPDARRDTGIRTTIGIPLLRDGIAIGAFTAYRTESRPFAEHEIALLRTFADQAAIAIENVRLFTESQEKNRALTQAYAQVTEALEQQTATGEILRVISRSQSDVQPVFDAIVRSAARLCAGLFSTLFQFDGELLHIIAVHNTTPEALEALHRLYPARPTQALVAGRAILERTVVHISDAELELESEQRAVARAVGWRSALIVPMLQEGAPIGVVTVGRTEAGPFSDGKIELLKTFAEQAVIAIENVRLFTELQGKNRELATALDQQTATSEILRAISRSPTDVQPVFNTVVQSGLRLLGGYSATMMLLRDDDRLDLVAYTSTSAEADASLVHAFPMPLRRIPAGERAVHERRAHAVEDIESAPDATDVMRETGRARGWRSNLFVPMIRDDLAVGLISITRREPGPFPADQIALLETFAAQAVIAIENVRLFKELQASNRDLTTALDQQTSTSEILRVIAGSPTDLQPVLDVLVESAGRLCQATDTFLLLVEGDQLRVAALHGAVDDDARFSNTIHRGWVAGRAVVDARTVHVGDLANAAAEFPFGAAIATRFGHRTVLAIPLLRKGVPIGALFLRRREIRSFSDAEMALLQTFADQAVIAIENVRLFKELEAANRELSAASQHKSEFLANMSHELRTPLNAIIGFSEVLADRMFGEVNEKQEEYLKDIHASGQHLLSLINDILDLSKIEAGRMELELTDFDLPTAIDNALTLVRERAARRGITLGCEIGERVGMIQGDERKVKQVLLNILSNGLKFTPEGGRIDVRTALKEGTVEISVTDTGVGIAPEDQEAIFEEFRQVGTSDKKVEGTGLGLALSRRFVELHGGRIWVKSQVGAGATFTFTIPVRSEPSDQGSSSSLSSASRPPKPSPSTG